METVLEEVPEAIHEEAMLIDEVTNGNGIEVLPSQTISFPFIPSTSSGNTISSEEATRLSNENKQLTLQLKVALERIAEQDETIRMQAEQLSEAGEPVQKQISCHLEEVIKLMEQKARSQTMETYVEEEDKEEFYRFKNLFKSLAEPYFVLTDRESVSKERVVGVDEVDKMCSDVMNEYHGLYQYIQALGKIAITLSLKATTAAPAEQTTATAIPTTNEEGGVVPPSQPINDGDAVDVEMPINSVQVVDGNGDASSVSPLPGSSQSLVSDDDHDDKTGEESPKPAKRARGIDFPHGQDPDFFVDEPKLQADDGDCTVLCHFCGNMFSSQNHFELHWKKSPCNWEKTQAGQKEE